MNTAAFHYKTKAKPECYHTFRAFPDRMASIKADRKSGAAGAAGGAGVGTERGADGIPPGGGGGGGVGTTAADVCIGGGGGGAGVGVPEIKCWFKYQFGSVRFNNPKRGILKI